MAYTNGFTKKAQVSIFIILGILMLGLVTTYYISTHSSSDMEVESVRATQLEEIADPIERYITECLIITSRKAIIQMGELGGYTDLSRHGFTMNMDNPTNSEAVVLSIGASENPSDSLYAIPYYFHMSSPSGCLSDCEFTLAFPEVNKGLGVPSIENELDLFINEHLDSCINEFDAFTRQGYNIRELAPPSVDSRVNVETISFVLYYPIEISLRGSEYRLENFYTFHNINLNEIYEMAMEITAWQARHRFLELQVLNLISSYSGVDSELPPMAETTFDFGSPGRVWVRTEVKRTMENILSKYVRLLRAVGSRNYVDLGADNELSSKLLDTQMRIELSRDYDLDVFFNYLDFWPIYFDITCDGEICRAESFSSSLLTLFGIQRYRFYYSVSHPVMVKIHDPNALDGDGFNYFFFLESNIRHSEPVAPGVSGGVENALVDSSLLCGENHRNTGEYELAVFDALTEEPVNDVSLYYSCGMQTCTIAMLDDGTFKGPLPVCGGGILSVSKPGYMSYGVPLSTQLDEGGEIPDIMLEPFRRLNLSVRKLKFVKPPADSETEDWVLVGEEGLKRGQEAIVILERKALPGESPHMQVVELSINNPRVEVELVPGEYDVKVYLTDRNTIIIPAERRQERALGGIIRETYYVPPEPIIFDEDSPWPLGGVEGTFTISNQIDIRNEIIVKAIAFEMGEVLPEEFRKAEDLEILSLLQNYTQDYYGNLGFAYR